MWLRAESRPHNRADTGCKSVATFVIGLVTLLAPSEVIRVFDGYDPTKHHIVRFIGTALIGFSVTGRLQTGFKGYSYACSSQRTVL